MRLRNRSDRPVGPDGNASCELCGDVVAISLSGHCSLGHRVTSTELAAAALQPPSETESDPDPQPEVDPLGTTARPFSDSDQQAVHGPLPADTRPGVAATGPTQTAPAQAAPAQAAPAVEAVSAPDEALARQQDSESAVELLGAPDPGPGPAPVSFEGRAPVMEQEPVAFAPPQPPVPPLGDGGPDEIAPVAGDPSDPRPRARQAAAHDQPPLPVWSTDSTDGDDPFQDLLDRAETRSR